ncbi:uncharacterized protein [Antedon mediterranea]|uniref:uncharacterized protein n=1 Tax=Antedon mediterranea TaxID=105859 RepID=UPI003AF7C07D
MSGVRKELSAVTSPDSTVCDQPLQSVKLEKCENSSSDNVYVKLEPDDMTSDPTDTYMSPAIPLTLNKKQRKSDTMRYFNSPFSYIEMIILSIDLNPKIMMTFKDIIDFMSNAFYFLRGEYTGWKNSVRHNLSCNDCFKKILRRPDKPHGKDNFWVLNFDGKHFDNTEKNTIELRIRYQIYLREVIETVDSSFPQQLMAFQKKLEYNNRDLAVSDGGDSNYSVRRGQTPCTVASFQNDTEDRTAESPLQHSPQRVASPESPLQIVEDSPCKPFPVALSSAVGGKTVNPEMTTPVNQCINRQSGDVSQDTYQVQFNHRVTSSDTIPQSVDDSPIQQIPIPVGLSQEFGNNGSPVSHLPSPFALSQAVQDIYKPVAYSHYNTPDIIPLPTPLANRKNQVVGNVPHPQSSLYPPIFANQHIVQRFCRQPKTPLPVSRHNIYTHTSYPSHVPMMPAGSRPTTQPLPIPVMTRTPYPMHYYNFSSSQQHGQKRPSNDEEPLDLSTTGAHDLSTTAAHDLSTKKRKTVLSSSATAQSSTSSPINYSHIGPKLSPHCTTPQAFHPPTTGLTSADPDYRHKGVGYAINKNCLFEYGKDGRIRPVDLYSSDAAGRQIYIISNPVYGPARPPRPPKPI